MASEVGLFEIALATAFVVVAMALSKLLRFELAKDIGIAALRTVGQLVLIGFLLAWIFDANSAWVVLLIYIAMTVIAAQAASARVRAKKMHYFKLALASLMISVWPVAFLGFMLVMDSGLLPARFSIPFFGFILGNSLNAISLTLIGVEKMATDSRDEIETFLALGATPWEASFRHYREITRSAITPILNAMAIVGVVSLPGLMAGQILAGTAPLEAAHFQIVVMFLLALTCLLGSLAVIAIKHRGSFRGRIFAS